MDTIRNELMDRIRDRSAVIGVVGLGYVGLPLALRFSAEGFSVTGFDIDPEKPARIAAGETYLSHISTERIQEAIDAGLTATCDYTRVAEVDAVILCVPTPLTEEREPDLSFVIQSMESIVPHLRPGQVVSLESTTYPGTTEEEILPRIESAGMVVGRDIFLVYSPEREDPGNANFDTRTIPKVCAGHTGACLEVGIHLYGQAIDEIVPVSSIKVAEMSKLMENIYRAVNIGMVNEMKMVADRMDINIHDVIDAARTKPFGFAPFYPGPGLGGHCIPIDPFYLSWKARQCGIDSRFIELAGEINTAMPGWVVHKLREALEKSGITLSGANILVLGISYKKNIDDMRESPAVAIMEQLRDAGASIAYHDPLVPRFPKMRRHAFDLESVGWNPEGLGNFDAVVIATDHDVFDYDALRHHARLIIDTRGRYAAEPGHNIVPA